MTKSDILTPRKTRVARPHRPVPTPRGTSKGSWIIETGGAGGGAGGGGEPAPPVSIDPVAEVIFRNNQKIEVDVAWTPSPSATPQNFTGVAVYLEDPDISSGDQTPLDGSVVLDASSQVSGQWVPARETDSFKSPAVVFPDSKTTYTQSRNVRIYLAAFGPGGQTVPVRANEAGATPNIMVEIPIGPGQGQSGMEWAFLVTNVAVTVTTDYNRPDPNYYLTFTYDPPDPSAPVPPGVNRFGGARIVYVYYDSANNPIFPGTDTGINVPVEQSANGYKSPVYTASAGGGHFRVYFCSEDDAQPLGIHDNSLVDGVTPWAEVVVPPIPGGTGSVSAPDVANFSISDQQVVYLLDGSFVDQATFSWSLPSGTDSVRYAGVYLYLVNTTGVTPVPYDLSGQQSNVDTSLIVDIPPPPIPSSTETWTIAAISVDTNGILADDPSNLQHSPMVTWDVGPPQPGSPGSGVEHAPLVSIDPGASATASQSMSADGVGIVSFSVGTWTDPTDNRFGGAQLAMVVNHDTTHPTLWSVPGNANSFTTPSIVSFGNIGASVPVDFYVISDDPQGNKNSLQAGTTPVIHYTYTPTAGAVIPARSGWFDKQQFAWVTNPDGTSTFQAQTFSAKVIQVGKTLVVGGAPASFGGSDNGQIAVLDAHGKLLDWLGEQQPSQGNGAPLWGAWLGQVWIGGTNPLDAPVFIDQQGIIEVGGIAAAQGSRYPYISVRDQTGLEMGRIGASIAQSTGLPGDNTGSSPPQITAGAWFTQLAAGGPNLTNWNVLIIPDPNNPVGSQFQIRNVNIFSIDYPARVATPPLNPEYRLDMGNNVWTAGTGASQYQFPGIHIYEVDGNPNHFGADFLNRGMVLRGHANQGCPPLASLVTYNGQPSGADLPAYQFWAELSMYSNASPYRMTIDLSSGTSPTNGNPYFQMFDLNGNLLFLIDGAGDVCIRGVLQGTPPGTGAPVIANAYSVSGVGPVIDAGGHWVGKPITGGAGSQSPWVADVEAAGWSLNNAGNIQCVSMAASSQYTMGGNVLINSNGAFVGAGVNVGNNGIGCGGLTTGGAGASIPGGPGTIFSAGLIWCPNNNIVCGSYNPGSLPVPSGYIMGDTVAAVHGIGANEGYWVAGGVQVIRNDGVYIGTGISMGNYPITGGYLQINYDASAPGPYNGGWGMVIGGGGAFYCSGDAVAHRYFIGGINSPVINELGRFVGQGIDVGGGPQTQANSIYCGYLSTNGGHIDTGSINIAGALGVAVLNVTQTLGCNQYFGPDGALVINNLDQFVGKGISCVGYGIGCSYLEVDFNQNLNPSNPWGLQVLGGGQAYFSNNITCASTIIANYSLNVAGWNVIDNNKVIYATQYNIGGTPVINTSGQFVGTVNTNGSVICSYLSTYMSGGSNTIDTVYLNVAANANVTGIVVANGGVQVNGWWVIDNSHQHFASNYFVSSWSQSQPVISSNGYFTGAGVSVGGPVSAGSLTIGGVQCAVAPGIWTGSMQTSNVCYAIVFGIYGVKVGYPQSVGFPNGASYTVNVPFLNHYSQPQNLAIEINGGLITYINLT